jgi:hypothetical protein
MLTPCGAQADAARDSGTPPCGARIAGRVKDCAKPSHMAANAQATSAPRIPTIFPVVPFEHRDLYPSL